MAKDFENPACRWSSVVEDNIGGVKIQRIFSEEGHCLNIKLEVVYEKYASLKIDWSKKDKRLVCFTWNLALKF